MAENIIDQIVAGLRSVAVEAYPERGDLRNIRVVGHTPKTDHYIYEMVADFSQGGERIAAKIYRGTKCGTAGAVKMARTEWANLNRVYELFRKRNLAGVPRPLGDFRELGAVVAEKLNGLPLQSIIMKAALLPGFTERYASAAEDGEPASGRGVLSIAARKSGEWLRNFHKVTADSSVPFEPDSLLAELERLCASCKGEGLEESSIRIILEGARNALARSKKTLPASAVLSEFTPLNIVVGEQGVAISDYARMQARGASIDDVAMFLASVEALEKYPFCNREITSRVQQEFTYAYGVPPAEQPILRVLKIRALLSMFAQGRNIKESAMRKKVMWATVMKRFIHQSAARSLAPAA
ncbi:MAG: hypothetical protein JO041_03485 [Acidobacteria bacterium]|nr:hypothetical protein [Acidobacteriota bacterium]